MKGNKILAAAGINIMQLQMLNNLSRAKFDESRVLGCTHTKHQMCIDIQSEHNYVILSGVIQRINYMFRPLYLAIIKLCLAYRVTALHTRLSNGRQDLVYSGQIHELNRMVPIFAIHILCTIF